MARAFILNPDIIVLLKLTKGIDVGAKVEIRQLIVKSAKEGKGYSIDHIRSIRSRGYER